MYPRPDGRPGRERPPDCAETLRLILHCHDGVVVHRLVAVVGPCCPQLGEAPRGGRELRFDGIHRLDNRICSCYVFKRLQKREPTLGLICNSV